MSSDLEYDIDDGGEFADNADEEEEDLQNEGDDEQFDEEEDQSHQQHQQQQQQNFDSGASIDEEFDGDDDAAQSHGNIKREMIDDNDEQIQSSNVSETGGDYDEETEDGKHNVGGSSSQQIEGMPIVKEEDLDENGVYKWKEYETAVVRKFSRETYELLHVPFSHGWKRELVIRQGASTAEKKVGDVYYYPADGSQKLRSCVELAAYLKAHPNLGLTKEHFTYSKQPIWRPPDEIVRPALARGCNYVHRPLYFQQATNQMKPNRGGKSVNVSINSSNAFRASGMMQKSGGRGKSPKKDNGRGDSVGFGPGKRKRVLPSRYDDDSFDLMLTSKRSKGSNGLKDSLSNGNSQDSMNSNGGPVRSNPVFSSHHISASRIERRLNLQKQLVQQVTQTLNEENVKKMKQLEDKEKTSKADNGQLSVKVDESMGQDSPKVKPSLATSQPLKIKIPKQHGVSQHSQLQAHLLAPNPIKKFGNGNSQFEEGAGQSLLHQDAPASAGQTSNAEDEDGSGGVGILPGAARQPCSAHCPGKRNQMPNLMCSRCFCLFHIGCVPDGIWLQNPNRFLCPNCVTPEDQLLAESADNPAVEQTSVDQSPSRVNHFQPMKHGKHSKHHQNLHAQSSHHNNGNNSYLPSTLTEADPVELQQMSPSMSITKMNPNIPQQSNLVQSGHSMLSSSRMGNGPSNSLLKTATNGYPMMTMNGGGLRRQKVRGGMIPSMGHHRKSMESMMSAGNEAFGHPSSATSSMSAKIMACAAMASQQMTRNGAFTLPPQISRKNGKFPGSHGQSSKMGFSMNNLQPSINHVYRLAQTNNGHSVVLKDKTVPYTHINSTPKYHPSSSFISKHQSKGLSRNGLNCYPIANSTPNLNEGMKIYEDKLSAIMAMDDDPELMPSRRHRAPNRYAKYLAKNSSVLNSFSSSLSSLIKVFDYLDTRDIINLRQTSRFWYQLTSMTPVWKCLRFRCLPIVDWSALSSKVMGSNLIGELDFDGVKISNSLNNDQSSDDSSSTRSSNRTEKLITFWRNFSTLHPRLNNVKALKFGTVPLFVLQEMAQLVAEESAADPFANLKLISIGNLIDEKRNEEPVLLTDVVSLLKAFKDVEALSVNSSYGFVASEEDGDSSDEALKSKRKELLQSMATSLSSYKNLKSLSLLSFKDLTASEFSLVLAQLDHSQLKTLELGSCASWSTGDGNTPLEEVAKCTEVTSLKLVGVSVDAESAVVPAIFENLILVERLTFDNLKVDDGGFAPWTSLTALFKSLPLIELRFSTSDPFTNRALFESARDLISNQRRPLHVTWSVSVSVDDIGHCFVPLSMDTFSAVPKSDFVKRYLSVLEPNEELYQIDESEKLVAVEMSTLMDLMNRDVNLNAFPGGHEPKVTVQIVPQ